MRAREGCRLNELMSDQGTGTARLLKCIKEWCLGFVLPLAIAQFQAGVQAQDPGQEKTVTALQVESTITLDGELNEPSWHLAEPATDFIQQNPRTGQPSSERTEVRLLYDDENLYVGVYGLAFRVFAATLSS